MRIDFQAFAFVSSLRFPPFTRFLQFIITPISCSVLMADKVWGMCVCVGKGSPLSYPDSRSRKQKLQNPGSLCKEAWNLHPVNISKVRSA